jgi:hypothetical protein
VEGARRARRASSRPCRFTTAQTLAQALIKTYVEKEVDEIYLVYNEFKSVVQQKVIVERLLPIRKLDFDPKEPAQDYIYEPEPAKIFGDILSRHVEVQVWRALLESQAAEHGARMAAMDCRQQERGRDDRSSHPVHEQGTPGRHHQGDHRGGVGSGDFGMKNDSKQGSTATVEAPPGAKVGRVVQIIGPVVDVEFDGAVPPIFQALRISDDGSGSGVPIDVIVEVEQHLGENRVRCVSMLATDGMVRGMKAVDQGGPISVPVGPGTLGPRV